jgi:hypothetical protein
LNANEKISKVFSCERQEEWGKESYVDERTREERIGIIWLKARMWKLRGISRGCDRGSAPYIRGRIMPRRCC